ncbi:MAG: hypothetical protein ACOYT8_03510 [Candidatus Dependentiae bacterium]
MRVKISMLMMLLCVVMSYLYAQEDIEGAIPSVLPSQEQNVTEMIPSVEVENLATQPVDASLSTVEQAAPLVTVPSGSDAQEITTVSESPQELQSELVTTPEGEFPSITSYSASQELSSTPSMPESLPEITPAPEFSEPEITPEPAPITKPEIIPTTDSVQPEPSFPADITEIDTMNLDEPKGNWLFKRFWWEKAERTYEKIKNLVDKIIESRLSFFQQRTDIDRTLFDPFYLTVGFEQGELRALNEFFQNELQQERLMRGTLRGQERALLQKLLEEKQTIQNVQSDLELVRKIDMSIDDALSKLIERISEARNYERQAWDKLKAIGRELSDLRAHENYLAMDAFWKNVNNINNYISHDFTNYFEELIQKAQTEIDRVKTASQALREKGIDLKQTVQELKQIAESQSAPESTEQEEQEPTVEKKSWLEWIWNGISWPFSALYSWVGSFFVSSVETEESINETEQ